MSTATVEPVHPAQLPVPPKTSATPQPPESPPLDGVHLLKQISDFLARYLHCSEHQRTVLALWIFHSHCFSAARATPYLHIRSQQKQSGKTLCLHLLSLLCERPAPTTGFTAATLTHRTNTLEVPIFLLDECQATLGSRTRSKNPILRAILANGFERGFGYSDRTHERNIFSPKAFAGIGQLPEALADRSIPILLEPLGTAKQNIQRFHPTRAATEAEPLFRDLKRWSEQNASRLEETPPYSYDEFPSGLSHRRQDMIEPLLHIADLIGGPWPVQARDALPALFAQELAQDRKDGLKLLSDLREAFAHHGHPERISTAALLDWLHTQPDRPWNREAPITSQTLAGLLQPFEIRSRTQRIGQASPARGYLLEDFAAQWERLLPPEPRSNTGGSPRQPVEKASKNAVCSNVVPAAERQYTADEKRAIEHFESQGYVPRDPDDDSPPAFSAGHIPFVMLGHAIAHRREREAKLKKAASRSSDNHPAAARNINNDAGCSNVSATEQDAQSRAEYDAAIAKLRALQQSLPACAEGYTRLAPTKRR
ncbi:MAG TPA: DUF3631 domain-containing protein [Candidatus Angelobacter sp.]